MKIIDKVKIFAMAGILAMMGIATVLPVAGVYAAQNTYNLNSGLDATKNGTDLAENTDLSQTVTDIINVILYVVGIVAVVMMIYGGFQYISSAGDAAKVTKAKNTILYGVVGLVIAILAFAIVNFVLGAVRN